MPPPVLLHKCNKVPPKFLCSCSVEPSRSEYLYTSFWYSVIPLSHILSYHLFSISCLVPILETTYLAFYSQHLQSCMPARPQPRTASNMSSSKLRRKLPLPPKHRVMLARTKISNVRRFYTKSSIRMQVARLKERRSWRHHTS